MDRRCCRTSVCYFMGASLLVRHLPAEWEKGKMQLFTLLEPGACADVMNFHLACRKCEKEENPACRR